MKTKTKLLLLLISISFFSCTGTVKNQAVTISKIDTDFPTTEELEFKPFRKYDILSQGRYVIDDSVLWSFEREEHNLGYCYDLHTGEKLSIIGSKGKAANEFTLLTGFKMIGDSVQFYEYQRSIKTFAKKDIINNVPMGERKFSVATVPDSIWVQEMVKLSNGSVLATIGLAPFVDQEVNEINQKSVALFNDKEARGYETIKYESFEDKEVRSDEMPMNERIKGAYGRGSIEIKGNDMAVFSVYNQFILYTLDLKSGNVVNEKRYTTQPTEKTTNLSNIDDRSLDILYMQTTDNYILCVVGEYTMDGNGVLERKSKSIFVFDWELNPIKKINLPLMENGYHIISTDCSAVYSCEFAEDGLILKKADLNL